MADSVDSISLPKIPLDHSRMLDIRDALNTSQHLAEALCLAIEGVHLERAQLNALATLGGLLRERLEAVDEMLEGISV